jgi:hypothetical protein
VEGDSEFDRRRITRWWIVYIRHRVWWRWWLAFAAQVPAEFARAAEDVVI